MISDAVARALTAMRYGETFAQKATAELCKILVRLSGADGSLYLMAPLPPGSLIVEFGRSPKAEAREKGLELLRGRAPLPVVSGAGARVARARARREEFEETVAPLLAEISRTAAKSRGGPEEWNPEASLDVCWVNRSCRAPFAPEALVELSSDPLVARVDVPHPLRLEERRGVAARAGAGAASNASGAGIVVAVIDTEIDIGHPAFAGQVVQKKDLSGEGWGMPLRHGTAVAALIASRDPAHPGVAPGSVIHNYKIFDRNEHGDDQAFAQGIRAAVEDGVHVLNCSWGAGDASDGTSREALACDTAWENGVVVVKSAGNRGPGPGTLTTPADAHGVIVVGGANAAGTAVAGISSRGPTSDGRERPHLVAVGGDDGESLTLAELPSGFGPGPVGTSFAAPIVSGLVALLLEENPDMTSDDVRDAVRARCALLAGYDGNAQGAGLFSP